VPRNREKCFRELQRPSEEMQNQFIELERPKEPPSLQLLENVNSGDDIHTMTFGSGMEVEETPTFLEKPGLPNI
jgi:hypothetical protein